MKTATAWISTRKEFSKGKNYRQTLRSAIFYAQKRCCRCSFCTLRFLSLTISPYFVDHLESGGVDKVIVMSLNDYLPEKRKSFFIDTSEMPKNRYEQRKTVYCDPSQRTFFCGNFVLIDVMVVLWYYLM